jgi:alanine racemase
MDALGIAEVDLGALARNYRRLASGAEPDAVGAVVKADAYGLGVEPVARRLSAAGCRHFFVATPDEGIALRRILDESGIFVFDGLCGTSREELLAAGLTPVLNSVEEIRRWGRTGPAAVHIDTGMSRLGLSSADVAALREEPAVAASVDVQYVLTHLACADEPEHPLNRRQLELFAELRSLWPDAKTSIGNSAGMLLGGDFRSDLARVGLALLGGNPFLDRAVDFEPVVTVRARVLQVREIGPGETVGYGASFVAEKPMRIAVVGLGYADGYLRSLSNRGVAEVAGQRVPVVGRVSMDLVNLDISSLDPGSVAQGDWATMIGGGISLEELAALGGTINYELLTALGPRLQRIYLEGDDG